MTTIHPFLLFEGKAEEAMRFYLSVFEKGLIESIERYEDDEQGRAGSVKLATFQLHGQRIACIDSHIEHGFGFTPALSLFISFTSESELRRVFERLSAGGELLMPLESGSVGPLFAWLNDRYGVSWQLYLNQPHLDRRESNDEK